MHALGALLTRNALFPPGPGWLLPAAKSGGKLVVDDVQLPGWLFATGAEEGEGGAAGGAGEAGAAAELAAAVRDATAELGQDGAAAAAAEEEAETSGEVGQDAHMAEAQGGPAPAQSAPQAPVQQMEGEWAGAAMRAGRGQP